MCQIANKKKGPKLVQYTSSRPLDNFITTTPANRPNKQSKQQADEDLFESLSDEEITCQLDIAFTEE